MAKSSKDRRKTLQDEVIEESRRKLGKAFCKLLPFGAQVLSSAAAYTIGVTATQLVGFVCKVSCATPVLGPCMGLIGVGMANALAGQASRHTRKLLTEGGNPLKPAFWEPIDMDDVVLDAVLGMFIFKAMGGRFSSVMPSDLSKPGALAFESIPAQPLNSESYAKPSVRRELARIFHRDGCHHCGSHRGPVIGDHMPPNKLMAHKRGAASINNFLGELPGFSKVCELVGIAGRPQRVVQRFYPQCQHCSIKQATALRTGKRMLVLHLQSPYHRRDWLAGVFVGIRHNIPPVAPMSAAADSYSRRQTGKRNVLALTAEATLDDNSNSKHSHAAQLVVEELQQQLPPCGWELGLQGLPAANAEVESGLAGSRSQHSNTSDGYMITGQQHVTQQHCSRLPDGRPIPPSAAGQQLPSGSAMGWAHHHHPMRPRSGTYEDAHMHSRDAAVDAAAAGSLLVPRHAKQRTEQAYGMVQHKLA